MIADIIGACTAGACIFFVLVMLHASFHDFWDGDGDDID